MLCTLFSLKKMLKQIYNNNNNNNNDTDNNKPSTMRNPFRLGSKLWWNVSGPSLGMSPRPSAIAHYVTLARRSAQPTKPNHTKLCNWMIYLLFYLLSIVFHLNSYILNDTGCSQLISSNKLITQYLNITVRNKWDIRYNSFKIKNLNIFRNEGTAPSTPI